MGCFISFRRFQHIRPDGTTEVTVAEERLPLAGALRAGLGKAVEACEVGVRNALTVSLACAIGGIIVGVIGLTGLGLKFSALMMTFSGGNIVLALFVVLIASLILGFGLPVTASYIVLIILVGPAMSAEFGIPLLIVHLVVFWYSQDSNVTPPLRLRDLRRRPLPKARPWRPAFRRGSSPRGSTSSRSSWSSIRRSSWAGRSRS